MGSLSQQIIHKIEQARTLYYRLVLVVTPSGAGKTEAMQDVSEQLNLPIININLRLSERLLDFTRHQRALRLPSILRNIIEETNRDIILLDNAEILFDVSLQQDPLRLLQSLSRNKTIVATWNGKIEQNHLIYAEPGHVEYKRYPMADFLVVSPDFKTDSDEI
jgi:hypothetical protein